MGMCPGTWATGDSRGLGLGTELAGALVTYGLETLDLPEMYATVDSQNHLSLKVLGKVGFVLSQLFKRLPADPSGRRVFR